MEEGKHHSAVEKGPRWVPSNYRPISLTSCVAKLFERMLLNRISPVVEPQLDNGQAGFRWGAEEQTYVLKETLHLRQRATTFCAFIDLKNAFGTCWVDAALCRLYRAGITGDIWKLICDMCTNCQSCIQVHGGTSAFGDNSGLGQGRVLSPLLFNVVINSAAAAIKRACPGVSLGRGHGSPNVTTLMYADDIVILAETAADLQRALDALSDWASRWRCSFCAGPDKSAVLVVNRRAPSQHDFKLGDSTLPIVEEYRYLGVVFDSRGKCKGHARHAVQKGGRKFATCVSWASREGLHVSWQSRLFQSYVLPAFAYGSEFFVGDRTILNSMDLQLRKWGRRILGFPNGTPNPVVFLELGWSDMHSIVLKRAASSFSWLSTRWHGHPRADLPGVVYAFARTQARSWTSCAHELLSQAGVSAPEASGLGPGAPAATRRRRCRAAHPILDRSSHQRTLQCAASMDSLSAYSAFCLQRGLLSVVHNRRVPAADAREWGLARCGHHWCSDGRMARHCHLSQRCCLCNSSDGTLMHALFVCARTADIRSDWSARISPPINQDFTLRTLFHLPDVSNVPAAVQFVARVCRRVSAAAAANRHHHSVLRG